MAILSGSTQCSILRPRPFGSVPSSCTQSYVRLGALISFCFVGPLFTDVSTRVSVQVPSTADTILRRLNAPDIPDLATSGWMQDDFNEGMGQGPTSKTELFKPLHERLDVQQLNVEVGAAMLFSKLTAPDQTAN